MAKNRTVYSTDPDWQPPCPVCGNPQDECICDRELEEPEKQNLRIRLEKKGRKGKTVTVISGYIGNAKNMLKTLQQLCGSGGSIKNGNLELQGDQVEKVKNYFSERGDVIK